MNTLITINKVSADMGISSRSLRYWEAAGLFQSVRDEQSGWRMYDDNALGCIRLTALLRRIDISVSDIKKVLEDKTPVALCLILKKQLRGLEKRHMELESLRAAITQILDMLESESPLNLPLLEGTLLSVALERKKHIISKSEGGFSMENTINKYDDVKLIKLAPSRAAAFTCVSAEPEEEAYGVVKDWLVQNNLEGTARIYGFNAEPYPTGEGSAYGFGYCATIPEGVQVQAPLYEMKLPGGVYAVVSDYEGDPSFGWKKVHELCGSSEWEWAYDTGRNPGLEEHIERADGGMMIPILFPVKKKTGK